MDRMNPLDAEFLYLEDGTAHMHIASCAVFEGPAPAYDDLVALFASKLPLVPRYRQRVRFVPMDLGRPVWVDDPHFDLEYHVRTTSHCPTTRTLQPIRPCRSWWSTSKATTLPAIAVDNFAPGAVRNTIVPSRTV
jgi:Wax ester synthase/diacylglycerol acyltransferase catalytic domain